MIPLFPAAPTALHYCQRLPVCSPEWVARTAQSHAVNSVVQPWFESLMLPPDPALFEELLALRVDWQAPWSRETGIQPPPGALGLSLATLECVVSGDGWLRWVRIGSPAIAPGHEGRAFAQVFTSLARGADGQPHYGQGAGVWRVSEDG